MTLKELITRVNFDALFPYLKEHEPNHLDSLPAFREAYDRLRSMEPNKDFYGEARVEWSGNEDDKWIDVYHLDGDLWENALAKEIVIADNVHLPIEKIAMLCLWEITYYGFSPDEQKETFESWHAPKRPRNKYEIALARLEESIWKHQTPRKRRSKGFNGELYTTFDPSDFCDKPMNRSKRKREYRQTKRIKYLKSMAKRENLIENLIVPGSSFVREDIDFLLGVNYGNHLIYQSVTTDLADRVPYVIDSLTKYQQIDLGKYNNAIVCVRVSSLYPLSEQELSRLKTVFQTHLGYPDFLFGTILCNEDRKEIHVDLFLNKLPDKTTQA